MAQVPQEVLNTLTQLQGQIWQTVSLAASESFGHSLSFSDASIYSTRLSELYDEVSAPTMYAQFSFGSAKDDTQAVLVPQETLLGLLSLASGESVSEIDENAVSDLRAPMEGIIQGICLAIGNIRSEPMAAAGMQVRYQVFNFPTNMLQSTDLVRCDIVLSGDGFAGPIFWLFDNETAHYMANTEMTAAPVGKSQDVDHLSAAFGRSSRNASQDDLSHLDILMDVPLEITVELGRVRMQVKDVLELTNGSVVEIDRIAGEPIDVLVNGRVVAKGEVVVVEDNFGVRITEILNPIDRANRALEVA